MIARALAAIAFWVVAATLPCLANAAAVPAPPSPPSFNYLYLIKHGSQEVLGDRTDRTFYTCDGRAFPIASSDVLKRTSMTCADATVDALALGDVVAIGRLYDRNGLRVVPVNQRIVGRAPEIVYRDLSAEGKLPVLDHDTFRRCDGTLMTISTLSNVIALFGTCKRSRRTRTWEERATSC